VVRGCRSELGGWELGCVALTGNAAQCLATYSPRCVLNEFRLLHINYHGLAKRQSQAQPSEQTAMSMSGSRGRDSDRDGGMPLKMKVEGRTKWQVAQAD